MSAVMGNIIVIAILAVIVFFCAKSVIGSIKGELSGGGCAGCSHNCGCCGGCTAQKSSKEGLLDNNSH